MNAVISVYDERGREMHRDVYNFELGRHAIVPDEPVQFEAPWKGAVGRYECEAEWLSPPLVVVVVEDRKRFRAGARVTLDGVRVNLNVDEGAL